MEFDITIIFCELYFNLSNKNIQITLINNEELNGHINGYYYTDLDDKNMKIETWHLIKNNEINTFKEFECSILIPHKLIKKVKYLDNNSQSQTIKFI